MPGHRRPAGRLGEPLSAPGWASGRAAVAECGCRGRGTPGGWRCGGAKNSLRIAHCGRGLLASPIKANARGVAAVGRLRIIGVVAVTVLAFGAASASGATRDHLVFTAGGELLPSPAPFSESSPEAVFTTGAGALAARSAPRPERSKKANLGPGTRPPSTR